MGERSGRNGPGTRSCVDAGPPFDVVDQPLCGLCRSLLGYVLGLGPFLTLDDLKLHVIPFLQALVALRLDGAVVDEYIRAVVPADEPETLCVVKPLYFPFDSRHDPCSSKLSWKITRSYLDFVLIWYSCLRNDAISDCASYVS